MGRWPADKYNVTCEESVNALADRCAARSVAARALFQQVCFAWITGNGDLHAKNLSILSTPQGEWRAAPAYDLPSTVPYGDRTFALSVQGKTQGFSRRRLLAFGVAVGLSERVCSKVIDELLDRTTELVEDVGALPFTQETIADLRAELTFRRSQIASPAKS
jgi:serine/threonine-protein kinase HipA